MKISATYKDDRLDGTYTRRDDRGRTVETISYRGGKFHGWRTRYEQGRIASEESFFDGALLYPKGRNIIRLELARIRKTTIYMARPGDTPAGDGEAKRTPARADVALAIRRLMEYRFLCDVPYEGMEADPQMIREATAAAKICNKLGQLTHFPKNPGLSPAEYKLAKFGASHGNLAMGSSVPASVDRYMDDSDAKNIDRVGHRRWCLYPPMRKTGFGTAGVYSSMRVSDRSRSDVPDFDFVAYPPRGLMPVGHFASGRAWNVSLNPKKYRKLDKQAVKVSVFPAQSRQFEPGNVDGLKPMPLNYFNVDDRNFGLPRCIIFRPDGVRLRSGARFWVRIEGIKTARGEDATIGYIVEFMSL